MSAIIDARTSVVGISKEARNTQTSVFCLASAIAEILCQQSAPPMKTISVRVEGDYLERLTSVPKPIIAIEELVWNSMDADATEVNVRIHENSLGGIDKIVIDDNGHGLDYDMAMKVFAKLGGSWKKRARKTKVKKRFLHGQAGKGRFRAFALGANVSWQSKYHDDNGHYEFSISGDVLNLKNFDIAEPCKQKSKKRTGMCVEILNVGKDYRSLKGDSAVHGIAERFALYLKQYPDVVITYDGKKVDPSLMESHSAIYTLQGVDVGDGRVIAASLMVIEWKVSAGRSMHLCDVDGFSLHEIQPGVHAPGFNFTAYINSPYLRELDDKGALALEEMHPVVKEYASLAKAKLREHFKARALENADDIITEWKRDDIYPYKNEPKNLIEQAERQVFDVVALNLQSYMPEFDKSEVKNKQLSLRLIRLALESGPSDLRRILEGVMDLPKDKQEEFAKLLDRTSLSAIINASKVVAERLDFLLALEHMVFDKASKKALLERQQLHKILAGETWIFGESFTFSVNDQSLTVVLEKHLELLKRTDDLADVKREDGSKGIIDMMLSRRIPSPKETEKEHLIIELKRPSKKIDDGVITQVESYAFAVAEDERFKNTNTSWVFWAVSNEMSDGVNRKANQKGRPQGMIYDDSQQRIVIWAKTWGQIIDDARARLTFFQDRLNYVANDDSAMTYLKETHSRYLSK